MVSNISHFFFVQRRNGIIKMAVTNFFAPLKWPEENALLKLHKILLLIFKSVFLEFLRSFHPSRGIFFRVFQVCGGLPPTKLEVTWGGTSPKEKNARRRRRFFFTKKVGRQWGHPKIQSGEGALFKKEQKWGALEKSAPKLPPR